MKKALFVLPVFILALWMGLRYFSLYRDNEIRLGMSAALTGDLRQLGMDFYRGANAYFQSINEEGGVYGRKIRLIIKDDKYEPKITEENLKNLIEVEKVFALFGIIGTPTSKAALPIAVENNIPMLASVSGAKFLRDPKNPLIFNIRQGYDKEIEALLHYLIDKKGHKRIAAFYQNDSFGHTGLRSLKKQLRKRGMDIVGEGSYKRNTLAVGHAIYELNESHPDAIVIIGAAKPTVEFIRRSLDTQLGDATKAILSFASAQTMMIDLQCSAKNLLFSQVVPLPWSDEKDVLEHKRLMAKYYPDSSIGFASLEGYYAAVAVVSIFKKVGPSFSKKDFIKLLKNISKDVFDESLAKRLDSDCMCLKDIYITQFRQEAFKVIGKYPDE